MTAGWFYNGTNPKLKSDWDQANDVHTPKVIIDGVVIDAGVIEFGAIAIKDGTTGHLAAVDIAGRVSVDGSSVTQPISAVALPLPTGAATAANQATALSTLGNISTSDAASSASLASLDAKTTVVNTGAIAFAAPQHVIIDSGNITATVGNVTVTSGNITVANAAGGSAVNIQDGGNSITVDGTVAATQSGTWNIGSVTTLPVGHNIIDSGVITSITNPVAATQSGTWTVGLNAGSAVIGHVVVDSGNITNITNAVAVTNAGLSNIDVALSTRLKAADTLAGVTTVTTVSTVSAITGGNITVNNGAGAAAVMIQDGGNTITVDGAVAVSGTIAFSNTTIDVGNITGNVSLPTGAATAANQATEIASLAALTVAQGAAVSGVTGPLIQALVSDTPNSYQDGTIEPVSLTGDGRLRVSSVQADISRIWNNTFNSPWLDENIFTLGENIYV